MEIEIKIGKGVEGEYKLLIPTTCRKVSRRHASIFWKDGEVSIVDNESTNGTYVNGRRIAKSKLKEDDVVWLGGKGGDEECYQVDVKKVIEDCRATEEKLRTDYSKEFQSVKQAYIDYQHEVSEVKKKATQQSQLPKLLASLVPAVIGLIILLASDDMTLRIVSMSVGSVLSGIVGILTMGKSSAANDIVTEHVTELQIKYQPQYRCPKCHKNIPLTTHWKKLEADGECPFKCGAKYVKPEQQG